MNNKIIFNSNTAYKPKFNPSLAPSMGYGMLLKIQLNALYILAMFYIIHQNFLCTKLSLYANKDYTKWHI